MIYVNDWFLKQYNKLIINGKSLFYVFEDLKDFDSDTRMCLRCQLVAEYLKL